MEQQPNFIQNNHSLPQWRPKIQQLPQQHMKQQPSLIQNNHNLPRWRPKINKYLNSIWNNNPTLYKTVIIGSLLRISLSIPYYWIWVTNITKKSFWFVIREKGKWFNSAKTNYLIVSLNSMLNIVRKWIGIYLKVCYLYS